MTHVEQITKNGHKVSVYVWNSKTFNTSIYINEDLYDSISTVRNIFRKYDSKDEAQYWINVICEDIENGRLQVITGKWHYTK